MDDAALRRRGVHWALHGQALQVAALARYSVFWAWYSAAKRSQELPLRTAIDVPLGVVGEVGRAEVGGHAVPRSGSGM